MFVDLSMCIAPTQVDGDVVTSDTSLQSSGTTPSVTFSFEKVSHYYLLPYIPLYWSNCYNNKLGGSVLSTCVTECCMILDSVVDWIVS